MSDFAQNCTTTTVIMDSVALILLVILTSNRILNSEGACTIDLRPVGDGGKVDVNLDCPSCSFYEYTLDAINCDIYSDLNVNRAYNLFNSDFIDCRNNECRRTYHLVNSSGFPRTITECPTNTATYTHAVENRQSLVLTSSLGALSGFLAVLLGLVSLGWACTCWKLKKLSREKIQVMVNDYVDTVSASRPNTVSNEESPSPVHEDMQTHQCEETNELYDLTKGYQSSEMINNNYDIPRRTSPQEPTYEKIRLTYSLPANVGFDVNGSGYDIPKKRQLVLQPPTEDDVIEEDEQSEEKDTVY